MLHFLLLHEGSCEIDFVGCVGCGCIAAADAMSYLSKDGSMGGTHAHVANFLICATTLANSLDSGT
jgi:hypothetical protein